MGSLAVWSTRWAGPSTGMGEIKSEGRRILEAQAPDVMHRHPVDQPMSTGLKAIDAMTPIGRGQRQLIIGDRQTGKTATQSIRSSTRRRTGSRATRRSRCVASTWPSARRVPRLPPVKQSLEEAGAMEYTTIVASPGLRFRRLQVHRAVHRFGHRPALDVPGQARPHRVR